MNQDKSLIKLSDFEEIFNEKATEYFKSCYQKYNFEFEALNNETQEKFCVEIIEKLLHQEIPRSGEHRKDSWEKGWGENYDALYSQKEFKKKALIPKYFRKENKILRWRSKFIKPIAPDFEYNSLGILLDWVFDKYAREAKHIYEFGCGPGHNILRCMEVNSGAIFWGLDWAESSQRIIRGLRESHNFKNLNAVNFDYFNPNFEFNIMKKSLVYTVASLEQVGEKWNFFIEYLLEQKPDICVHIEPIEEVLDQDNLIDYLSIKYFEKRDYLSGFLSGLRALERESRIVIDSVIRTHIGSFFIEGYTIVIWRPVLPP